MKTMRALLFNFIILILLRLQGVISQGYTPAGSAAESLYMDLSTLDAIHTKSILNQKSSQKCLSGCIKSEEEGGDIKLINILEDFEQKNNGEKGIQISPRSQQKQQDDRVFYVLKSKTIIGKQVELLLQLNQQKDFYLNTYNNFIRCVKMTISCRDDSFLDIVAEDVNDRLRFQYRNINFEEKEDQESSADIDLSIFTIQTSNYDQPFNLRVLRKTTQILLFSLDESFIMSDKYIHLKYKASSDEMFGLGERNYKFKLEFNNSDYTLWNRDSPNDIETASASGGHNTYGSHPVYLMKDTNPSTEYNTTDSNFHLVYLQNVNAMDVFLSKSNEIEYRITGGILDFKIIGCHQPRYCVQRYNKFLGKQALMPLWAYGFHQSRWGYSNIYEVKQVMDEYNNIEFPVESVFLDIDYMINYNTFTVNETNFPLNDKVIMQDIEKRIVPILDVAIGLEIKNLQVRQDALNDGVGIKDLENNVYIGRVWPGYTLFPDFEKPITKVFWQNYTANFMKEYNISSFWLDMNEYANFCHGICEELSNGYRSQYNLDVELFVEGLPYLPGSRSLESMSLSLVSLHESSGNLEFNFHNMNGYLHSQSTYKAVKYEMQNPLPFLISRSTIPGSGNYVAHWAGDNSASYQFMAYSISSLFNFHIFGIDFTGSDICGFMKNTSEQLCNRWGQLGSLYPFSRNHNHEKLMSQEFFTFDEFGGALYSFRQKYSLLKYYYTLSLNHTYKIQPAIMNFPNNPYLYENQIIETHIMIGDHILSVPVLQPNKTYYDIYFPTGRWFNISSGQMYENPKNEIKRFTNYYNQAIDLFVREGHFIFQQHQKVLESSQLNNMYHLKCGFREQPPYVCSGIIMSINDFSENNVYQKCTEPFNCLYSINLLYDQTLQKLTLKFDYLDEEQYNLPQSIYIDSLTIFSKIFKTTSFQSSRKIYKNQQLYKNHFNVTLLNDYTGIQIKTQLHLLYDTQFEFHF